MTSKVQNLQPFNSQITPSHQLPHIYLIQKLRTNYSFNYYQNSNHINQIIHYQSTIANINFQEYQYIDQQQEFLRRIYIFSQYKNKIKAINQYYTYHTQVPHIFHKNICKIYKSWQQNKKQMEYRKLKKILNKSIVSQKSQKSRIQKNENQQQQNIENILNQISQYNPQSKKYFIRKKQKQQKKQKKDRKKKENFNKYIPNKLENSIGMIDIHNKLSHLLSQCSFIQDISNIFAQQNFQKIDHKKQLTQPLKKKSILVDPLIVKKSLVLKNINNDNYNQNETAKKYSKTINSNFGLNNRKFSLQKIQYNTSTKIKILENDKKNNINNVQLPRYKSLTTVKINVKNKNDLEGTAAQRKQLVFQNNDNRLPHFESAKKKSVQKSFVAITQKKISKNIEKIKILGNLKESIEFPKNNNNNKLKPELLFTKKKSNIFSNHKLEKLSNIEQQNIKKILLNRFDPK